MFLTQRQIYLGVFLLLIVGAILGSLAYIIRGDNPTTLTIVLAFIPFASGCLWAYQRGWEQARYAMALLLSILAPISLTEPYITGQFSLVLFVAPSLALLLTNPVWAFGSAVACVLVTLARAGWQGAHADPISLLLYGMVIGAITISRIATDSALRLQSQAQQVLRTNEARGRALLNAIPDLMFRIDRRGTIIDYNAPGESLLFMPPAMFLHRPLTEVLPADLAQRVVQAIAQAQQTRSLQLFEYDWATPAVGEHASEARIVAAEDGETIIISRDITERKHAEMALRQSEAKFSRVFYASPAIIVISDLATGKLIDVNDGFVQATGYSYAEAIGRTTADLGVSREPERRAGLIARLQRSQRIRDTEMSFYTRSGEQRTGLMSMELIDISGQPHLLTMVLDITERKRAEAEREALIGELEAKNAELERFTYTVSHDLKSPLITIRGFLGYIEQDARTGNFARLQSDLARIGSAASKMQQLLDELLALSRIGRLMHPPQLLAFAELAHEALALVAGQISERHVDVVLAPDLPLIYGDRIRLVELLQNLLDNAIKFMGGQPQPRIEIGHRAAELPTLAVLTVRDNGIGIDPLYHEKVFGLFDKLDAQSVGTGVGLALAKRIVEVHGGKIWVETNGDQAGTTFCFTLPSALAATASEGSKQ